MALPADFSIDVNDRLPSLVVQALDGNKVAIDLSAAVTASFHMTLADGSGPVISGSCTFLSPRTNGWVQYDWAAGDTAVGGRYNAEVEFDFGSGKTMTIPNTKIKIQIDVNPEIA